MYVYEYLLHVGAQKSAQTFLSEVRVPGRGRAERRGRAGPHCALSPQIRWEKNITLGEPPGFLHSWWWCVRAAGGRGTRREAEQPDSLPPTPTPQRVLGLVLRRAGPQGSL